MKNNLKPILYSILIFTSISCKSRKTDIDLFSKIDNSSSFEIKNSSLSKEDLVYKAVIEYEILELGNSFVVVDKSKDDCSSENSETDIQFFENNKTNYWKKELFKGLNYLSGDVVYNYLQNDFKEYKKLRNKYGSNGWFELSSPCFSANDEYAIIKVDFGRSMSFSTTNHYLLKKTNRGYRIIKSLRK
jgi:hypothetical protein